MMILLSLLFGLALAAEVRVSTPAAGVAAAGIRAGQPAGPAPASRPAKAKRRPPRPSADLVPRWAKQKPRFMERGGRRLAVAVGSATTENQALGRSVAQDRARAALLRLLQGKPAGADAEGTLAGARVVNSFRTKGGRHYVEVEVEFP